MIVKKNNKLNSINVVFILLAIFFSVLSQTPLFRVEYNIDTQLLSAPLWLMVLIMSFFNRKKMNNVNISFSLLFFLLFIFGVIFLESVTGLNYINSIMTNSIFISLIMIFVGYLNKDILDKSLLIKISLVYITASIFLSIDIYLNYLRNYNFDVVDYVFRAKNSAGQIILTALVFLLFMYTPSKLIGKISKIIIILLFIYVIIAMRSRASIISILFIPLVYIAQKEISLKLKISIVLLIIFSVISVLLSNNLYDLIVNNILLNNSISKGSLYSIDLNTITSRRYEYIYIFPQLIDEHLLTGIGSYYMDNFYFAAILNYGLLLGGLVIIFALYPLFVFFFKSNNEKNIIPIRIIAIIYVFNGFFECLAPFGPGIKCFILWFLLGIFSNRKLKYNEG